MSPKNDTATLVSADTASNLVPLLDTQLKNMASAAMWPKYIIDAIFVTYQDGDLLVDYPDKIAKEIDNLEYGNFEVLPNPVIRPFIARSGKTIKSAIGLQSIDAIFTLEDVFNG